VVPIVIALVLASAGTAYATAITNHSGFSAGQTVITFDDASGEGTTPVTTQYASKGCDVQRPLLLVCLDLRGPCLARCGGSVAADFAGNACPCFNDVTATFSGTVKRAGFDTYGNLGDSIELKAYKGRALVDDHTFSIPRPGFIGLDVPGGFTRLVIHTSGPDNGAYAMDDFRFDCLVGGAAWVPPQPHAAMCSAPGNTNPYTGATIPPGTFLDLLAAQIPTDPDYAGATPAIFVEGKGVDLRPAAAWLHPAGLRRQRAVRGGELLHLLGAAAGLRVRRAASPGPRTRSPVSPGEGLSPARAEP
jgi:hypothetical protein